MDFDRAFLEVVGNEGGYTNNTTDPGNWTGGRPGSGKLVGTKFGISAKTYPSLDIKNLTLAQAKAIYKKDYWDKVKAEQFPASVRLDVFDDAVNIGQERAVKLLQTALGAKPDGDIGPITLAAAFAIDPQLLDKRYIGQVLLYLCDLKTFTGFGKGWVRRRARRLIGD